MGRYDRLQVFNGSSWVKPREVQVYDGSKYVTLGADDSYETKHIYANNGGSNYPRVTKYRHDYTITGEQYSYGSFSLNGSCCWNPVPTTSGDHYFECDIKKTTNSAVTIFESKNSSGSAYIRIIWNADGSITFGVKYQNSNNPYSITTTNKVGANTWVHLKIYANKVGDNNPNRGSGPMSIVFNGVTTKGTYTNTFSISGATNTIGGSNVQFKGILKACFAYYTGSGAKVQSWEINMSTKPITAIKGTLKSNGTTVINTTTTGTEWL